jgi:hypothetical protein
MGNFISKEDILVEIAILFKQMENGKLTIDELEELVKLSRDLHERTLILRYKAFEEKIFGVRPAAVEVHTPVEEIVIKEVAQVELIEEPIPEIEAEIEVDPIVEQHVIEEEIIDDAPLFKVEVKDEPSFGFSLFGNDLETEEEVITPIIETPIAEEPIKVIERQEVIVESSIPVTTPEPIVSTQPEVVQQQAPVERTMSEVERAHAENLARFISKKTEIQSAQENSVVEERPIINEPVAPSPSAPSFEKVESFFTPKIEPIKEIIPEPEIEVTETPFFQQHQEPIKEEVREYIPEPIQEVVIPIVSEEKVGEVSSYSYGDLAQYIHKYNIVDSNLASQIGVTKISSLIGSFGLNERLQFINELFDGSSENFSNAIKTLDVQASSENARTKVAEFAVSNNWEVESETVVEFMQKIVRRYA